MREDFGVPTLGSSFSSIQNLTRQTPKTIVGFCSIMTGIGITGALGLVLVLAGTQTHLWMIPYLSGFILLLPILVLAVVLNLAARDPSKLMLGQVTGTEYAEIQRITMLNSEFPDQAEARRVLEVTEKLEKQTQTPPRLSNRKEP